MAKLFGNSGDPDQTPHAVASDLGLHCLLITLLGVSRLKWVKIAVVKTSIMYTYSCRDILGLNSSDNDNSSKSAVF